MQSIQSQRNASKKKKLVSKPDGLRKVTSERGEIQGRKRYIIHDRSWVSKSGLDCAGDSKQRRVTSLAHSPASPFASAERG